MDAERYGYLSYGNGELTPAEIAEGWHFCVEWDGLLVGPGMLEINCCLCLEKDLLKRLIAELPSAQRDPTREAD